MNDRTVNIVFLLVLLPLALFSIPLATGRIARNKTYGYRTAMSLRSDADWYRANRMAGQAGLVVCLANNALDLLVLSGAITISFALRLVLLVSSFGILFAYVEARLRLPK
jgi:hypothetical protein